MEDQVDMEALSEEVVDMVEVVGMVEVLLAVVVMVADL
jgi:hypothetical protein